MLVLRSILFSFSILWRLTLVMPFIIIALAIFGGMLVLWLATAALFFPSLLILAGTIIFAFPQLAFIAIMGAIFATTSVVPMMIGSRLGLQAKGVIVKGGYGTLILPALGYGIFEALVALILMSGGFGLFMLLSPLSLADLAAFGEAGAEAEIAFAVAENTGLGWGILIGIGFAIVALRAAILVPLAGASIGRDPNGSPHTPFWGIGTRFPYLFVVVVMAYAASYFLGPVIVIAADLIGMDDSLLAAFEDPQPGDPNPFIGGGMSPILGWQFATLVAVMFVYNIWIFSLQCAAGTLAYLQRTVEEDALKVEEEVANRMDPAEVRELWKSRMPPGNK